MWAQRITAGRAASGAKEQPRDACSMLTEHHRSVSYLTHVDVVGALFFL